MRGQRRRRSVLAAAGLCAVGVVAVASGLVLRGPVDATLRDTGAHHAAGRAGADGTALGDVGHDGRAGIGERGTTRHASRTGRSRTAAPDAGTEEAGTEESLTRTVEYTGANTTTFTYPGAEYVKVHFSRMVLRPGDFVTVADPSGEQSYTYHEDPRLATLPGDAPATVTGRDGFWAMSITGDTALVTLHKTLPGPSLGRLGVAIDRVAHGFTAAERSTRDHRERIADGGREPESVCGGDDSRDAVCYRTSNPVEYQHSLPVARLLINGTTLCTAWRLTAGDRMLTNNHCLTDQADVDSTEVWFNYQCATCGGGDVERVTKVPADRLLRTDRTLDYSLFTVRDFDAIKQFGYLGIDDRVPRAGEQVYIPQHPEGEPTRLAIASDQDPNSTCQIDEAMANGYATNSDTTYRCDTAPGSSGSPVISRRTNEVIALHHFGGCPNSGVRIDLVYAQIKSLL